MGDNPFKKEDTDWRDTLNGVSRNSIRLRRVLLLRSDIRRKPSDICSASLWGE